MVEYFSSAAGKNLLESLQKQGLDPQSDNYQPKPAEVDLSLQPLAGKTFVITGTLSIPRDEIKQWIESKGGKVSGSVSASTTYLLCGEAGGSKRDKAEALGVAIIDEAQLRQMLE